MGNYVLGFCFWDIIALIVLLAVIIGFSIRTRSLKKEEKELEGDLSDNMAGSASGKSNL